MRPRYSFGSHHTGNLKNIKKQRAKYPDVMNEVISTSDIVLQILDSRFITETRNTDIEEDIKIKGKKLINVLNKSDLVSIKKTEGKLPKKLKPYVFVSAISGKGIRALRQKISIQAKKIDLGKDKEKGERINVGIIGYPNVGKSSIINLITKRGVASVSKQAGHTKGLQKIKMTDSILVLDTPGVIPEEEYSTDKKERFAQDAKIGARTYSNVKDPEDIVHYLITPITPKDEEKITTREKRLIKETQHNAEMIQKYYGINAEGNSEVLIEELGKQKNYLKKGGKVNIDRTARLILKDWQEGRIHQHKGK